MKFDKNFLIEISKGIALFVASYIVFMVMFRHDFAAIPNFIYSNF